MKAVLWASQKHLIYLLSEAFWFLLKRSCCAAEVGAGACEQHMCVSSTWHLPMKDIHDEPVAPGPGQRRGTPLLLLWCSHGDSAKLQFLHVALVFGREECVFTHCCVPPAERSTLCHPV